MKCEIPKDIMRDMVKEKILNELVENRVIKGNIEDDDIESTLNIMIKEEKTVEDAFFEHVTKSDMWIEVFDENRAYRDFGRINEVQYRRYAHNKHILTDGGIELTGVDKRDYTYFVKKSKRLFYHFVGSLYKDKYDKQFIELMDYIVEQEGMNYEQIAWCEINRY